MSRLLKIILSIIAVIVALIVIAAIALPFFIDPNDFKPEIQAAVRDNTGRELMIDGDLELSVFPWIGVSTGKLTLSNAKGFAKKNFAEIEASNIKVKLLPLLSKKLEVSRVVLKGLVLNLAKNKKGVSNWDDLTKADTSTPQAKADTSTQAKTTPVIDDKTAKESVSPLAALAVGGISIEQAKIVWDDQQQGKYTEINDFNFSTGELVFDEAIDVALSLVVINKKPELTESLTLSTNLVLNEELNNFQLNSLNIKSVTKGKDIPGESLTVTLLTDIVIDLAKQTLNVANLTLNSDSLSLTANINGTQIIDKPVFKGRINIAQFNLAQLMKKMAMPLPAMQDPGAMSKLSLAFDLLATTDSADIKNLVIHLDDTTINASTNINNFAKPAIKFNIKVDDIDIDRYLPPPAKDDKKASKPAVTPVATTTPASAVAASSELFPVKLLRDLNVNGQLTIDKLKVSKLNMQGFQLNLSAKNGLIKTNQTIKQLYQGSYSGDTVMNVKNRTPTLSLTETFNQVHIEPLLKDMQGEARMTGVINTAASVTSRGNSIDAIKAALNGNASFSFKDGVIKGFNLQKIIDSSEALVKGVAMPTGNKNDQTVFSIIKGTTQITNGLIKNNDLYAEASKLRVNGKGTVHLVSEKLNYKVNAKVLKTLVTATSPEKIKGYPVIINVGGNFSKPTYTLDVAAMLMEKNKGKINKKKDELLKKLDDKIGPGVSDLLKGFL